MSTIATAASAPFQFLSSTGPRIASAAPSSTAPTNVAADYEAWRTAADVEAMSSDFVARIDTARETFIAVAQRAQESGGLDDPQAFVKSLNINELAALQATHGLADPVNPATLSKEGAYNLLMVRGQERDLDKDGLTEIGIGRSIIFPPRDAPQAVKDAWDSATAGLDGLTRGAMTLSGWIGARGGGLTPSGMADYAKADFDWQDFAKEMVGAMQDNLKYQATPDQQRQALAKLDAFKDFLSQLS